LRQQGVDWRFVAHNVLVLPLPFEDESFDLIHFGSMCVVFENDWNWWLLFMDECFRILKPGGYLEMRELYYIIRRIAPCARIPEEKEWQKHGKHDCQINHKGCFPLESGTEFATYENEFINDRNTWMTV
jgi:SAM-dependent methyltransferase